MTAKKSPASKTSRSTRTKAELEEQIEELEARLSEQPEIGQQAAVLAKEHVKEVRGAVKDISVDAIVAQGAQFGLQAQRTVSSLTEQIAAKATELQQIQEAIKVETEELARLYDLDVVSASTQALIEGHKEKKDTLELELAQARASWNEEVQIHNKQVQLRNAELEQSRRREQNEYDYKTKQDRARASDEFTQQMLVQDRAQQERIGIVEKDLNARIDILAAQEKDYAAAKLRIEGLDAEISAKSATAVAIATNSLKKDLMGAFALEKKDLETQLRVLEQQKISVDQANEKLAQQVVQMTGQLEAARAQVVTISERALESASGQVALTAVRETVKENGQQGGGRKS